VEEGRLVLDLRTVGAGEDEPLLAALLRAAELDGGGDPRDG
jgi:hypothetical protein